MRSFVLTRIVLLAALGGSAVGCCSNARPDPRKYFHHSSPVATVESFRYGVAAGDWPFVSDIIWVEPGELVARERCFELFELLYRAPLEAARVDESADGTEATVVLPVSEPVREATGREEVWIALRSDAKIDGVVIWLVDITRSVESGAEAIVYRDDRR